MVQGACKLIDELMPYKRHRPILLAIVISSLLAWLWYEYEYRIFNFDDGPYYSRAFVGEIAQLPLQSHVELLRLGNVAYVLESRILNNEEGSVLVLKRPDGTIRWKRQPVKPDGPLGEIELRQKYTSLTWYGGWNVSIKPAFQESGYLYLGPLGGFRFFYHSW